MPPIPRALSRALVAAWVMVGAAGGAALLAGNSVAGPARVSVGSRPTPRGAVATADGAGRAPETWSVLHILYASCRCSEGIFAHLFDRRPLPDVAERLVLLAAAHGDAGQVASIRTRAIAAGFAVETVEPDALVERFGVGAAPLLVVADPAGRVRYAGGYADPKRGAGTDPRDGATAIIRDLMNGRGSPVGPPLARAVLERLEDALGPRRGPGAGVAAGVN